jgi:hypothetical protein
MRRVGRMLWVIGMLGMVVLGHVNFLLSGDALGPIPARPKIRKPSDITRDTIRDTWNDDIRPPAYDRSIPSCVPRRIGAFLSAR